MHFALSPNIRNLARTHIVHREASQRPGKGTTQLYGHGLSTFNRIRKDRHSFHTCLVTKLLSLTREVTPNAHSSHTHSVGVSSLHAVLLFPTFSLTHTYAVGAAISCLYDVLFFHTPALQARLLAHMHTVVNYRRLF